MWSTLFSMITVILWPHHYHGKICRHILIDNEIPIIFGELNALLPFPEYKGKDLNYCDAVKTMPSFHINTNNI